MTRVAMILLVTSAAWLLMSQAAWCQDAPKADEPKAADAEKADSPDAQKTEAAADEGQAEGEEFRLDFGDVKDLRDADIVLPEIGETPAPPVEGEAGEGAEKPEETPDAAGNDAPEEKEINPTEVVERIVEGMGESAERLGEKKDPGEQTQTVQKKVVDDLSELIEYVKQQQAQASQSQQQQNQQSQRDENEARRRRQQQQQRGQQQGRQPQPRGAQQPMQDEMATKGSVTEEELEEVAKMMAERWGDLLPNAPRETLQAIPEMILPKYRLLLSRYFYALARQAAEKAAEEGGTP